MLIVSIWCNSEYHLHVAQGGGVERFEEQSPKDKRSFSIWLQEGAMITEQRKIIYIQDDRIGRQFRYASLKSRGSAP
ncbi:hypothetical protein AU255_19250 [Methyloprofundus sedimenti]|uniref:Uncharacterized protein n=1 Tax=Methyloprofundus sedimenti TaxID=1420851 RepID=A0A1V8M0U1_9GAMM|nr:hypothetical protein AU255_19250 [Methyloprofundus sedimenti]